MRHTLKKIIKFYTQKVVEHNTRKIHKMMGQVAFGAELNKDAKKYIDLVFESAFNAVDNDEYDNLSMVKQNDLFKFVGSHYKSADEYFEEVQRIMLEIEEYIVENHGSFLNWVLLPQYDVEQDLSVIIIVFTGYDLNLEHYRSRRRDMLPSFKKQITKFYDYSQMANFYYQENRDEVVEDIAKMTALLQSGRIMDAMEVKDELTKKKLDYIGYNEEEE